MLLFYFSSFMTPFSLIFFKSLLICPQVKGYCLTIYTNYVLNSNSKHSSYAGKRSRTLKKLIYSQKLFFNTLFLECFCNFAPSKI